MNRTKYSTEFQRLWDAFDSSLGEKGSKIKAYKVFQKMQIDADDVDYIIKSYQRQADSKMKLRSAGQFSPNFQAVERYLKNERFDDEVSADAYQQVERLTKSEQADQKLREYLTRNYGEGLENLAGNEKSH